MAKELEKGKEIVKGLDAFFMYRDKCKTEGKKPTTLKEFFSKYNLETLELAASTPPLRKYVQRYYREIEKMQLKAEGK